MRNNVIYNYLFNVNDDKGKYKKQKKELEYFSEIIQPLLIYEDKNTETYYWSPNNKKRYEYIWLFYLLL